MFDGFRDLWGCVVACVSGAGVGGLSFNGVCSLPGFGYFKVSEIVRVVYGRFSSNKTSAEFFSGGVGFIVVV